MNNQEPLIKPLIELNEWQSVKSDKIKEAFGEIFLSEKDLHQCDALTQKRFIEIIDHRKGISIQTRSYVGRLSFDAFDLQINPKLDQLPLINMFKYGYQLKNMHFFDSHNLQAGEQAIQDLIINQLLNEVQRLLRRGLFQNYQEKKQSLTAIRGRVDFARYFSNCSTASNVIPCVHHPRTFDNELNQFIKSGLKFAGSITIDPNLKLECLRVSSLIPASEKNRKHLALLYKQVCRKSSRLNNQYQPAIDIIRLLLGGEGALLDGEITSIPIPGFLFDMNILFQNVISRFLHENAKGCDVLDEYSLKGMMVFTRSSRPIKRGNPTPRPDFVIKKDKEIVAILDAKYRDLWVNPLPREMLYQLGMYALVHNDIRKATILYPTTSSNACTEKIIINDPIKGNYQGSVILCPVNIFKLEEMILLPASAVNNRVKSGFAEYMIFW
jgi:5-methylcytosine-specific restriction enzyme subunit McrC